MLGMLGPAQGSATLDGSKATRVRVRAEFQNGRMVDASVVILILEDADEPFRVLSWRNNTDGPLDDEPPRAGLR